MAVSIRGAVLHTKCIVNAMLPISTSLDGAAILHAKCQDDASMAEIISIPRQVLHRPGGGAAAPAAGRRPHRARRQAQRARAERAAAASRARRCARRSRCWPPKGLVDLLPNRGAVAVKLTRAGRGRHLRGASPGSKASRANSRRSASPTPNSPRSARCTTRCWPPSRAATCPTYYRLNALIHAAHQRRRAQPGADADLGAASTRACRRCAFAPTWTRRSGSARCRSTSR